MKCCFTQRRNILIQSCNRHIAQNIIILPRILLLSVLNRARRRNQLLLIKIHPQLRNNRGVLLPNQLRSPRLTPRPVPIRSRIPRSLRQIALPRGIVQLINKRLHLRHLHQILIRRTRDHLRRRHLIFFRILRVLQRFFSFRGLLLIFILLFFLLKQLNIRRVFLNHRGHLLLNRRRRGFQLRHKQLGADDFNRFLKNLLS